MLKERINQPSVIKKSADTLDRLNIRL